MQLITSKDNEKIKHIRKLKDKKYRDEHNQFVVEGIKMLEEAINENADIALVVICDECIKKETFINSKLLYEIADRNCISVCKKIFSTLTDVVNPQGILAVINKPKIINKINYNEDFILILDDIKDPGNLGTILRTLDSIGAKQLIISKNSVDVYNNKVIRSTMGAIFRINIIESENLVKTISNIKKNNFKILSTALNNNSKSMYEIKLKKVAVIIGNEANGVSNQILEASDEFIKIPMLGSTESLNASIASAVIMYEYVRQRLYK